MSTEVVNRITANKQFKIAARILEHCNLNPKNFPELIASLTKSALRYFIIKNDLCMFQLIELVIESDEMLKIVIEELVLISNRNEESWEAGFASYLSKEYPDIRYQDDTEIFLKRVIPKKPVKIEDRFEPLQAEFDLHLSLPREKIFFIDNIDLVQSVVWKGTLVGLDCEWRPSLVKFQKSRVSIMQIALEDMVYIFDVIALNKYEEFDEKIEELMQSKIYKIGVNFEGDQKMMRENYPHMRAFSKKIVNYVDIIEVYCEVYLRSPGGLAGACELLLGQTLCKYEQRSNWECRPLKESQIHYAALDAFVEIGIIEMILKQSSLDLAEFVGLEKKSIYSGENCAYCNAKGHESHVCVRGPRCKICYRTGHAALSCPYFF